MFVVSRTTPRMVDLVRKLALLLQKAETERVDTTGTIVVADKFKETPEIIELQALITQEFTTNVVSVYLERNIPS
jgi:hypothetical protein